MSLQDHLNKVLREARGDKAPVAPGPGATPVSQYEKAPAPPPVPPAAAPPPAPARKGGMKHADRSSDAKPPSKKLNWIDDADEALEQAQRPVFSAPGRAVSAYNNYMSKRSSAYADYVNDADGGAENEDAAGNAGAERAASSAGGGGNTGPSRRARSDVYVPAEDNCDSEAQRANPLPMDEAGSSSEKRGEKKRRRRTHARANTVFTVKTMSANEAARCMKFAKPAIEAPVAQTYIPQCAVATTRFLASCVRANLRKLVFGNISDYTGVSKNKDLLEGFALMDMYIDVQLDIELMSKRRRTYQQRQLTKYVRISAIPKIFGKNFATYMTAIMKREKISTINSYVSASLARRSGKTVGTALNIVSLVTCVPNVRVGLFAPSSRQSVMLLDAFKEQFKYLESWTKQKGKPWTAQKVVIMSKRDALDKREIDAYPCEENISGMKTTLSVLVWRWRWRWRWRRNAVEVWVVAITSLIFNQKSVI